MSEDEEQRFILHIGQHLVKVFDDGCSATVGGSDCSAVGSDLLRDRSRIAHEEIFAGHDIEQGPGVPNRIIGIVEWSHGIQHPAGGLLITAVAIGMEQ